MCCFDQIRDFCCEMLFEHPVPFFLVGGVAGDIMVVFRRDSWIDIRKNDREQSVTKVWW